MDMANLYPLIVDLRMKNVVIFHISISLPEGIIVGFYYVIYWIGCPKRTPGPPEKSQAV